MAKWLLISLALGGCANITSLGLNGQMVCSQKLTGILYLCGDYETRFKEQNLPARSQINLGGAEVISVDTTKKVD
jgi:hypothetical protein